MKLDPDGTQLFPAAFTPARIEALAVLLGDSLGDRPGTRLEPTLGLAEAVQPATAIAQSVLGAATRPVRAVLFDKSPNRNWALGWHQDRTVAIRSRIDTPGFTDWTIKHGIDHAVPPFEFLETMLTARIHLDPVGPDNAPLLVVPGSHRLGRIAEPDIAGAVAKLGEVACPAERGDLWLYATPILHASDRAKRPARRRVLQVLYSAKDLPNRLEWLGI
jgi:ectoine hydroxylase-related dioxygenase (phytanoyl-CoA dioxygenase family)